MIDRFSFSGINHFVQIVERFSLYVRLSTRICNTLWTMLFANELDGFRSSGRRKKTNASNFAEFMEGFRLAID